MATKHKRDLLVPASGVCGVGYVWPSSVPPSSILLMKNWSDVDCPACLQIRQDLIDSRKDRLAPHGGCNWRGCIECFPETATPGA